MGGGGHQSLSVLVYLYSCSQLVEIIIVLCFCSMLNPGESRLDGCFFSSFSILCFFLFLVIMFRQDMCRGRQL